MNQFERDQKHSDRDYRALPIPPGRKGEELQPSSISPGQASPSRMQAYMNATSLSSPTREALSPKQQSFASSLANNPFSSAGRYLKNNFAKLHADAAPPSRDEDSEFTQNSEHTRSVYTYKPDTVIRRDSNVVPDFDEDVAK